MSARDSSHEYEIVHMSKTVAIVEDDPEVRQSLTRVLERTPGITCLGGFSSAEDALREVPALKPQILLMDVNLPGMNGVECVRKLGPLVPATLILMLTVHDDTDTIFDALSAGASGYLLKPVSAPELLAAIRDVQAGGAPMTSNIARKVVQSFIKPVVKVDEDAASLSPREREILDLLAQGYIYKEIAERLDIAYRTVHTHIERIYGKLHVRSRSQAVAKYRGL
jgi:DNA-binding NarL/FixJ family response regulator